MRLQRLSHAGCRANARDWAAEAELLRDMANGDALSSHGKAQLIRQAAAAERQSHAWLSVAREEAGLTSSPSSRGKLPRPPRRVVAA